MSLAKHLSNTRGAVIRLASFFAVTALAISVVHVLVGLGLRQIDTAAFGVFNRIVDGRINATVLITGSSRALNHYDPREITRRTGATAWNIGVNGSQTDMQLAVLKTYLQHNTAPALLIHNLDSFSFVTSREGIAFPELYLPYLNEPRIYETLHSLDSAWWKARYLPLYGYAVDDMRFSWVTGLAALAGQMPREVRFNGFEPRSASWTEDFALFRQANPQGVSFPLDPSAIQDLEDIVTTAASHGARVLLVYSPVYYEMQSLDRAKAAIFAHFRQIAEKRGALLWDYSDSPICRRRELFYNSQHLNAEGAAAFSEDLARRLASSGLVAVRDDAALVGGGGFLSSGRSAE